MRVLLLLPLLLAGRCLAEASASFHELARRGDAAALQAAMAATGGPHELNSADAYGWTPLFWAVDGGHVDAIKVGVTRALRRAAGGCYVHVTRRERAGGRRSPQRLEDPWGAKCGVQWGGHTGGPLGRRRCRQRFQERGVMGSRQVDCADVGVSGGHEVLMQGVLMQVLMQGGADVRKGRDGWTALMWA
eukprot:3027343-Pyramimonas_sp.AAC.1